jgi:hypothetical protein
MKPIDGGAPMVRVQLGALPVIGAMVALMYGCCKVKLPSVTPSPPDITGTWERYPDDWAGPDPDNPRPPGGAFDLQEPYAGAYAKLQKRKAAADAAGAPLVNASTRCLPEGMPTLMEAIYPIQIVQTSGQLIVLAEFLTQTRRIWLDEKMPASDDISPSYNGQSVGHWEGDTLVMETAGVRTDVSFHGVPHTAGMRITERIRKTAPDMLEDRVTIHDPPVFRKPYAFTFQYKKSDYRISEYICDNNQIGVDAEGRGHLNLRSKDD